MRENSNFDFKMESISNIDDLISWWKGANHEDQSTITTLCSFPDYLKRLFKESSCGGKCFVIAFLLLITSLFLFFVLALSALVAVISNATDVYIFLVHVMFYLYIALIVLLVTNVIFIFLVSMKKIKIVAPDQYQSKYDLFNKAISNYGINVEKLASYCNKKIIEIDDKIKEYQTYWKVFILTIILSPFLSFLSSFQNFIFEIYERDAIGDVNILLNGLTSLWTLIGIILVFLCFIYIVGMILIRIIYSSYTNRKTYYSLFTLSNSFMIF